MYQSHEKSCQTMETNDHLALKRMHTVRATFKQLPQRLALDMVQHCKSTWQFFLLGGGPMPSPFLHNHCLPLQPKNAQKNKSFLSRNGTVLSCFSARTEQVSPAPPQTRAPATPPHSWIGTSESESTVSSRKINRALVSGMGLDGPVRPWGFTPPPPGPLR